MYMCCISQCFVQPAQLTWSHTYIVERAAYKMGDQSVLVCMPGECRGECCDLPFVSNSLTANPCSCNLIVCWQLSRNHEKWWGNKVWGQGLSLLCPSLDDSVCWHRQLWIKGMSSGCRLLSIMNILSCKTVLNGFVKFVLGSNLKICCNNVMMKP